MRMTVIPIVIGALGKVSKELGKGRERVGNRRTNPDHPNYGIVEISQNTEKSPGDQKRIAVIQTPVKGHQLTLVKIFARSRIIIMIIIIMRVLKIPMLEELSDSLRQIDSGICLIIEGEWFETSGFLSNTNAYFVIYLTIAVCKTSWNQKSHTFFHDIKYINLIYIHYIYIYILSNAKSADGRNDSVFGFSFYNIHVIQNPKESSLCNNNKLYYRANNFI